MVRRTEASIRVLRKLPSMRAAHVQRSADRQVGVGWPRPACVLALPAPEDRSAGSIDRLVSAGGDRGRRPFGANGFRGRSHDTQISTTTQRPPPDQSAGRRANCDLITRHSKDGVGDGRCEGSAGRPRPARRRPTPRLVLRAPSRTSRVPRKRRLTTESPRILPMIVESPVHARMRWTEAAGEQLST